MAQLTIMLAPSPLMVGPACLAHAMVIFPVSLPVSSGWADALVDATGSFDAGLLGIAACLLQLEF